LHNTEPYGGVEADDAAAAACGVAGSLGRRLNSVPAASCICTNSMGGREERTKKAKAAKSRQTPLTGSRG
jgi:hypothetical protein